MSEINQGGFVYACAAENGHQPGITRRDWLAGLAMQGLLSSDSELDLESFTRQCYLLADAMIAESAKPS